MSSSLVVAVLLHVTVYADLDRNGSRGPDEPGVANVLVTAGIAHHAVTDAHGEATLDVPAAEHAPIVASVPDGFRPRPAWKPWPGAATAVAIGLRPLREPVARPLRIVVASDTHVSAAQPFGADLEAVAEAAVDLDPAPALFVVLGDIAQGGRPEQYQLFDRQLAHLGMPVVRVAGNHDWYDDGVAWERAYGPANYSFDYGGAHVVVWNMAVGDADVRAWLAVDLARVTPGTPIIGMTHAPPAQAVIDTLEQYGVKLLLTGHLHGNRVVRHDELLELSTEPLLMGGIDGTPAGYRIVTIEDGRISVEHRAVVDAPVLGVTSPGAGQCVPPQAVAPLLVAASGDAVTARVDCGPPVALHTFGSWAFSGNLPPLAAGTHALALDARDAAGDATHRDLAITVCAGPPAAARDVARVARWATNIGGHLLTAAPRIANGVVYVTGTELADQNGSRVDAIDLATGRILWTHNSRVTIRGAAAVVEDPGGDTVVIAQVDGVVLGLDARAGEERWRTDVSDGVPLPAGAVFAGPTVAGGDVFVGGQRRFAALDGRTGRELWTTDPIPDAPDWVDFVTLAPVAVARGLVVGAFSREQSGLEAFDRVTGARAWRVARGSVQPASPAGVVEGVGVGIAGAPVVVRDTVFVATSADEVVALDLDTGAVRWRTALDPAGFDWGAAILGAPAYRGGILVVPTLYGDAVAVDATSGAVLWRHASAAPGPLRLTHYRGAGEAGFAATPVIADDVVWLAGTDGELVALALATGAELWRMPLGAPVIAGLALEGKTLVVATFDGTVSALVPGAPAVADLDVAAACGVPRAGGGCCDGGGGGGGSVALAALLSLLARRRRPPAGTVSHM